MGRKPGCWGLVLAVLLFCTPALAQPALDTCDGAFGKFRDIYGGACPREQGGDGEEKHTPASCGNAECADLISSIDDNALAKMKTGLQV